MLKTLLSNHGAGKFQAVLLICVLALLAFIFIDRMAGSTLVTYGVVKNKRIETKVKKLSDGSTRRERNYIVKIHIPNMQDDISPDVDKSEYDIVNPGDQVTVTYTLGRFTKQMYVKHVKKAYFMSDQKSPAKKQ